MGYIYILTNPSFPQYVKTGYATDVKQRLDELNRSSRCRLHSAYTLHTRLTPHCPIKSCIPYWTV